MLMAQRDMAMAASYCRRLSGRRGVDFFRRGRASLQRPLAASAIPSLAVEEGSAAGDLAGFCAAADATRIPQTKMRIVKRRRARFIGELIMDRLEIPSTRRSISWRLM